MSSDKRRRRIMGAIFWLAVIVVFVVSEATGGLISDGREMEALALSAVLFGVFLLAAFILEAVDRRADS